MRGLEPRLSKYLTVKYIIIIIKQKRLIKHQLFTSDVDVESWLKLLNSCGNTRLRFVFPQHFSFSRTFTLVSITR